MNIINMQILLRFLVVPPLTNPGSAPGMRALEHFSLFIYCLLGMRERQDRRLDHPSSRRTPLPPSTSSRLAPSTGLRVGDPTITNNPTWGMELSCMIRIWLTQLYVLEKLVQFVVAKVIIIYYKYSMFINGLLAT